MEKKLKAIQFIDSHYRELFKIPDGGSIRIIYPPGDGRAPVTRACRYRDDLHFETLGKGGDLYHICQFAEIMERIGARYEPEVWLRDAELTPFSPGEEKFFTYNREEGNTCVGHLAGEFGRSGDRFHSSWSDRENDRATPEFEGELHGMVYALRQIFLADRDTMTEFCKAFPEAQLDSGDRYSRYGFKLESDTRQYFISCFFGEYQQDSRFMLYAYDKPVPELEQARLGEVLPGAAADRELFYRNDAESSRHIGYLRGDYGRNGQEFHHTWFEHDSGRKTPEFQFEFQSVMDALRQSVLKDLKSARDYCHKHPEARLQGDMDRYGFKVETESRQFFVRCTTLSNDYFYVFAYDKAPALEQEKPSVVKQLRAAQNAPKPPRKAKSPDKSKDGAER